MSRGLPLLLNSLKPLGPSIKGKSMKIIDFAYGAGTVRHRSETEHGIIMPSIGKGFHWKGDNVNGIVLVLSSFFHGPRRSGQTMVLALADGCQICNLSYSEKYEIFDADSSLKRESFWDEDH